MKKILVNAKYGGYPDELERDNPEVIAQVESGNPVYVSHYPAYELNGRTIPAHEYRTELRVVTIPDGYDFYEIIEYDGLESVRASKSEILYL